MKSRSRPTLKTVEASDSFVRNDRVVRLATDAARIDTADQRRGHDVPLIVGVMEQRLGDAVDLFLKHALAGEREGCRRKPALLVLARLQPVDAVVGEEFQPQGPIAGIDRAVEVHSMPP